MNQQIDVNTIESLSESEAKELYFQALEEAKLLKTELYLCKAISRLNKDKDFQFVIKNKFIKEYKKNYSELLRTLGDKEIINRILGKFTGVLELEKFLIRDYNVTKTYQARLNECYNMMDMLRSKAGIAERIPSEQEFIEEQLAEE